MNALISYLLQNYIETLGVFLSFCYLFFSVRGKVWLWVFGFLSAVCYFIVFFQSKFYALGLLQLYYMSMSVYGFFFWITCKEEDNDEFVKISKIGGKQALISLLIASGCFGLLFWVINNYTESPVPLGDSFTASLCIVGTWLLARKILENWLLFIVADTICVGLFIYQQMYLTALLFVVYAVMAIVGYSRWCSQYRSQM